MKYLQYAAIGLIAIGLFSYVVDGQKKPSKKSSKKPAVEQPVIPTLDVRTAREKVVIQRDNVNRFVEVMGPIAEGIELLDKRAKVKPLPSSTAAKHEANKKSVIDAIRNLEEGLAVLESEFRTKPDLQKYLPRIQGISDLAARSEDLAISGKFIAAKEPLRDVVGHLMDTLAVLPFTAGSGGLVK
jgi:hypothetical protein